MAFSLSFNIPNPLAALVGSIFSSTNMQFPPDASGPSITFTAMLNPGQTFSPNEPVSNNLFAFSQGSVRLYMPQNIHTVRTMKKVRFQIF